MAAARVAIEHLADAPLEAAADFYARYIPRLRELAQVEDVLAIFSPAGHAHKGWRLAAMQELAREAAPRRVNGIEGTDADAIAATADYCDRAPGITGHLLRVGAIAGKIG